METEISVETIKDSMPLELKNQLRKESCLEEFVLEVFAVVNKTKNKQVSFITLTKDLNYITSEVLMRTFSFHRSIKGYDYWNTIYIKLLRDEQSALQFVKYHH